MHFDMCISSSFICSKNAQLFNYACDRYFSGLHFFADIMKTGESFCMPLTHTFVAFKIYVCAHTHTHTQPRNSF